MGMTDLKRAAIFDPYLDTLGGGERYCLTLAEFLARGGWQVDVFWPDGKIRKALTLRFNLDLDKVNFVPLPENTVDKVLKMRRYDFLFWLSDGSIPFSLSKNSLLHFQVPFQRVNGKSILNQLKLKRIKSIVCNSQFTKKFIDKEFGVCSKVIHPPVDVASFRPGEKENLILSVGRFSQLLQAKRQDVLVSAFKKLCDQGLTSWQLVIAGATGVGGEEYFKKLKEQSANYPIKLLTNLPFDELKKIYEKSKIFWFASGFGINEDLEPEKVEHFGMVVVEAMAAGLVPVVVGKGGIGEIINEGENGFFFKDEDDLVKKTKELIAFSQDLSRISKEAIKSSKNFSKERFCQEFNKIIKLRV